MTNIHAEPCCSGPAAACVAWECAARLLRGAATGAATCISMRKSETRASFHRIGSGGRKARNVNAPAAAAAAAVGTVGMHRIHQLHRVAGPILHRLHANSDAVSCVQIK